MPPTCCSGDATPAEANRALVDSAGALTDEEVEYFASICDRTDDDAAVREMPDADGWTAEQRVEQIEDWRRKRRRIARSAIRPGETADEWRERRIAQMVAEHGCAPLVIPARRLEDVVEIDLAKVSRRDRKRLYKSGGSKSLHARRPHQSRRPRPRSRRTAARRAAGLRSGQDPGDDDGESEPAGDLAPLADRRRTPGGRP